MEKSGAATTVMDAYKNSGKLEVNGAATAEMGAYKDSGELQLAKNNGAATAETGAYMDSGEVEAAKKSGAATAEMGAYKGSGELAVAKKNGEATPETGAYKDSAKLEVAKKNGTTMCAYKDSDKIELTEENCAATPDMGTYNKNLIELDVAEENGVATPEMYAYKNFGKLKVADENGAATSQKLGAYKNSGKLEVAGKNGSATPAMVVYEYSGMTRTAQSGMTDIGSRVLPEVALGGVVKAHVVGSGVSPSAWSGMSYADSLMAPLISGVPSVDRNGVKRNDLTLMAPLGAGVAVACHDMLTPHLGSGAPPVVAGRTGVAYPNLLMAPPVPPASSENAVAYLDWLTANPAARVPSMAGNGMVYAMDKAPDAGAVSHIVNVTDGAAEFRFEDLEVVAGDKGDGVTAGAFTDERMRRGLAFLGLAVASVAVTGLTAGEATTATGLGLMAMLLGGLSLVTLRVLRD